MLVILVKLFDCLVIIKIFRWYICNSIEFNGIEVFVWNNNCVLLLIYMYSLYRYYVWGCEMWIKMEIVKIYSYYKIYFEKNYIFLV